MNESRSLHKGDLMPEHHYTVYFEPLTEGGYQVVFPAIPEIVTWGRTLDEARVMAHDALRCHLEGLKADGEPLPVEEHAPEGELVKETVAITV
jgi:predicted RNase H-like HicB family nuclease